MKDFYQAERFKIELSLLLANIAYPLVILLLWVRLKHLYGSYVYPSGPTGHNHPESFVSWLAPWCVYLALATMIGVCVSIMVIYQLSFSGKDLCVDCLTVKRRTFTASKDDISREYVCPFHLDERREAEAWRIAEERARAEEIGPCPRCHRPMRKGIQKVLGIFVISDICPEHGRFDDWYEIELFARAAREAGHQDQQLHSHLGIRWLGRHAHTAAATSATDTTTSPVLYLDELDASSGLVNMVSRPVVQRSATGLSVFINANTPRAAWGV